MTTNDILLYSQIIAFISHHQRGLFPQQMEPTDLQPDNTQRGRSWNTQFFIECLHQISLLGDLGSPWKRRLNECESKRIWKTQVQQDPVNQLNKVYMKSQRPKQQAQGQYKPVLGSKHTYYRFYCYIFMGLVDV